MTGRKRSAAYHWRGRPERCAPALLEQTFVGDADLLQRLLERFASGSGGRQRHFQLLVGGAGMGKSHTAALLSARLAAEAAGGLRCAWLPRYLTQGGDLGLSLRWLLGELGQQVGAMEDVGELQAAVEAALDQPLLLVVEDLDHYLDGLREEGQRLLRGLLQQSGQIQMLATARRVPAALRDQGLPFFGFFNVAELPLAEFETVQELLARLSHAEGGAPLRKAVRAVGHRPGLRALYQILGGRPGRYVGLLRGIEDLQDPGRMLCRALENRERKFRHQCQLLSRQQGLLLHWLAIQERAFSVKDCARALGLVEQSASPQLRALRKAGHVQATVVGRETWYEVEDPLCAWDPDAALSWMDFLIGAEGRELDALQGPIADRLRKARDDPDPRARLRISSLQRAWLAEDGRRLAAAGQDSGRA